MSFLKKAVFLLGVVLAVGLQTAQADVVSFSIGRLLKEPAADLKTDTTKVLTGLTCAWTCTDTADKAAEYGVRGALPPLVPYTGAIDNCQAPNKTVISNFRGCCRGAPYNDWGVVANGVIGGQKFRKVLPCSGTP